MTYSSSEAISSNKAAEIVVKLRNLKIAAMQMYVDKLDIWQGDKDDAKDAFTMDNVKTHLNDDNGYDDFVIVKEKDVSDDGDYAKMEWYVACKLWDYAKKDLDKVKAKLEKRAGTDDLLGYSVSTGDTIHDDYTVGTLREQFKTNYSVVLLRIR